MKDVKLAGEAGSADKEATILFFLIIPAKCYTGELRGRGDQLCFTRMLATKCVYISGASIEKLRDHRFAGICNLVFPLGAIAQFSYIQCSW